MTFDPYRHHRRSIRLANYDYSQAGLYFVTLCTNERQHLFGHIDQQGLNLSIQGQMIDRWWQKLPSKFHHCFLHDFVIMPNHFHGIIEITNSHIGSLAQMIQWFKTMTTNEYLRGIKQQNWPAFNGRLWQRNYYEHIIRHQQSHQNIAQYIQNNPARWQQDKFWTP